MNSNQSTPASAVAALQQEIRTRTEVIRTLADLREQLDADRICGAWLSAENNLSASIRRIGEGMWRILVFDHALCYKRLVQDGIIALRRHRLWLGADDDNRVIYDAATETLTIGCYGRFVPEDSILLASNSVDVHGGGATSNSSVYTTINAPWYGVPYRCLLPLGAENLLLAGRCLSANSDAAGAVRVMPPVMAMGHAAGVAAALALKGGISPRGLGAEDLRTELKKQNAFL